MVFVALIVAAGLVATGCWAGHQIAKTKEPILPPPPPRTVGFPLGEEGEWFVIEGLKARPAIRGEILTDGQFAARFTRTTRISWPFAWWPAVPGGVRTLWMDVTFRPDDESVANYREPSAPDVTAEDVEALLAQLPYHLQYRQGAFDEDECVNRSAYGWIRAAAAQSRDGGSIRIELLHGNL